MKRIIEFIVFILLVGISLPIYAKIAEKPLVVLIPSYNNKEWYKKNLDTVYFQNYENYRVIYIDDCSPDGTGDLVEKYVKQVGQEHRTIVIKNKQRVRALANLYRGMQLCHDDEIVMTYDGDDWFAHNEVFNLINEIYQDEQIWITYGSFKNWPTGEKGVSKPVTEEMIVNRWYRKKWWYPGQLRTYYGWLFKQIKLEDLIFEGPYFRGNFFPANYDLAIYYPMMEMAGRHFKYIDEAIYVRNVQTPLNDFKVNKEVQVLGSHILRHKKPYENLQGPTSGYFDHLHDACADIILFSANRPEQLKATLISFSDFLLDVGQVTVVYQARNEQIQEEYKKLSSLFDSAIFAEHPFGSSVSLQKLVLTALRDAPAEHVLFATDGIIAHSFVDLNRCINLLERTFAYGFYLAFGDTSQYSYYTGHSQALPPRVILESDVAAWVFGYGQRDWREYHNMAMTLYRKQDVFEQFQQMTFNSPEDLFNQWRAIEVNLEKVGLCFDVPKVGYQQWSMPIY